MVWLLDEEVHKIPSQEIALITLERTSINGKLIPFCETKWLIIHTFSKYIEKVNLGDVSIGVKKVLCFFFVWVVFLLNFSHYLFDLFFTKKY